MAVALRGMPVEEFSLPEDIVEMKSDPETSLLAKDDNPDSIVDYFRRGTEPRQYAESAKKQKASHFYMLDQGGQVETTKKNLKDIDEVPN